MKAKGTAALIAGVLLALAIPVSGAAATPAYSATWTRAAAGPAIFWDTDAFAPTIGQLVVFGGSSWSSGLRRETHLFDPVKDTWTKLPVQSTGPSARALARMVWDTDLGRIVLFGGRDSSGTALQDTWSFDPATRTWTVAMNAATGADGARTTTVTARDNADCTGGSATANAAYTVDNTAPTVTATFNPTPNAQGWNNTDLTLTWTATDAGSGVASSPTPATHTQTIPTGFP